MDFLEENEIILMINYLEKFLYLVIICVFMKFFVILGLRFGYLLIKNDLLVEVFM